jgi:hypothetical protein
MSEIYDDRHPMVVRLREIFEDPQPPSTVTQRQFDGAQEDLVALAGKPWSEIGKARGELWAYLDDMCYEPLQPELFNHVFPALLLRWWEGQRSRRGGPEKGGCDLYKAIDDGCVFDKMMEPPRRAAVLDWMGRAYIDGVEAWSGHLDPSRSPDGVHNLHGPLWAFHALGQSVPVLDRIWGPLCDVVTPGRAQWWLVLATGFAFEENGCPAIPPWTPKGGGGGVYVLESSTPIYQHGYLPSNLAVVRAALGPAMVEGQLARATALLTKDSELRWAEQVRQAIQEDYELFELRVALFLDALAEPELGG